MDFAVGFRKSLAAALVVLIYLVSSVNAHAQATAGKRPNILVIMGDDIGWFNVGAYHRGIMSGKTPNIDRLASQGMMFTDYYAERAVRRVGPILLPANCPSVPG